MIRVIWNIEAALNALAAMAGRLRDLSPLWRGILPYLRRQSELQFSTLGGRSGDEWQELSDRYAQWKAVHYPGQPILKASGEMFRSLIEEGNADTIADVTPGQLDYGTRNPKAGYHQTGGGRLPARVVLAVTNEDREAIQNAARAYLRGQAEISGFTPVKG